jgi:Tol biopolymer transport system component/DNA-binding winged helix-turn-helix (wHTH) protein
MRSWKIPGRVMSQQTNGIYEFGSFRLDAQERLLQCDGATISLTPKAFDLLLALVERHGRLVDKEELFQTVWPDTIVEESNLSSNIALIRKALGDGENGQKFIETVPKRGYRFVAEVREAPPPAGDLIREKAQSHAEATQPDVASSLPKRTSRWVWPAVFLAASVIISAAVWLMVDRQRAKAPMAPARIVPFTSFAGGESQPAFSPDGKQIAFVWGGENDDNNDIYVKLIGTEKPLRLTTNPATDSSPTWSPDGRYIAFLRQSAAGNGFYIMPALGGPERKVADADGYIPTEGIPLRLAWHPQGEFLVVADRSSPADPFSLFLLSIETREKRRLTQPRLTQPPVQYFGDWNPAFSPDGKTLAFTRAENGISLDIYLVPVGGGEPQRLTFDRAHLKSLAWTPDGREIVFLSSRGGSVNTSTLWKIPAAGGTPERLTGVGQNVFTLAIDRQANRLAYEQRIHDTNIYRIDVSDSTGQGAPHTKMISSTFQDDSPDYSPDGKRIVYVSDRTGSLEIWLCDGDGANPIQLTNFGGPHTGTPRWSPDGRKIVFDSGVEGNQEIFIISVDGGKPRRLTSDPALDMIPSWSRDGRWIYFVSNRSGDSQVWKVPAEGGQAVQVTRQGGFEAFESADGKFIYYSKWISLPGIWRVPVEGGEETLILDLQNTGHRRSWAVVEQGLYFAAAETPSSSVVEFFSFATGQVERRVAMLERSIKQGPPGLTASPDGRWILYTRIDQSGSDIMLMENFR